MPPSTWPSWPGRGSPTARCRGCGPASGSPASSTTTSGSSPASSMMSTSRSRRHPSLAAVPEPREVLRSVAQRHPAARQLDEQLSEAVSERDADIWLGVQLEKGAGNRSPAVTVAAECGLRPDAVRKVCQRVTERLDAGRGQRTGRRRGNSWRCSRHLVGGRRASAGARPSGRVVRRSPYVSSGTPRTGELRATSRGDGGSRRRDGTSCVPHGPPLGVGGRSASSSVWQLDLHRSPLDGSTDAGTPATPPSPASATASAPPPAPTAGAAEPKEGQSPLGAV